MKLSIIIVHYNTPDLLNNCLKSIYAQDYRFNYEVIVIDNASKLFTGIEKKFPQAKIIRNYSNSGFAKANNQGLKLSRGEYILFLNPDTEVLKDSLEKMIEFLELHPDTGALGPKLIYPDGALQFSCRKFYSVRTILMSRLSIARCIFNRKILNDHLMLDNLKDSATQADWLMAACIMLPKRMLEKIGGFDEGYRLYFEDVDLCYRIKQTGAKIIYYPIPTVMHHHRRDSAKGLSVKTIWHIASAVRFFNKFGWKL
jgi:hypothetical protein